MALYSFPTKVRKAIGTKFLELQEEQRRISGRIRDQVERTKATIRGYRGRFEAFAAVGLQHRSDALKKLEDDVTSV